MDLPLGKNTVVIQSNAVTEIAGKEVVKLTCESKQLETEPINVIIWLTEKSMGIARAQLKLCGFDVDKEELGILNTNPTRLQGKEIPIIVEDWQGQLRASIQINPVPTKTRLDEIQAGLRAAKKSGEAPVVVEEDPLPF